MSIHELPILSVKQFNMLEVPVPVFQDLNLYIMDKLRCTRIKGFRGWSSRTNWVWFEVGNGYELLENSKEGFPAICKA
jgi:hypothetical protein